MELVHFSLLVLGWVYLITQSTILRPVRKTVAGLGGFFATLIYCPPCTAFWVGLTLGFTPWWPHSAFSGAIVATALGAVWKEWGPQQDTWALDWGDHDRESEEEDGEDP